METAAAQAPVHGNFKRESRSPADQDQGGGGSRRQAEAPGCRSGRRVQQIPHPETPTLAGIVRKPMSFRSVAGPHRAFVSIQDSIPSGRPTPRPRRSVVDIRGGDGVTPSSTGSPVGGGRLDAFGKGIPAVQAETVGMSSQRLERIAQLNRRYVDEGRIPGVLTAVLRSGKLVHQSATGTRSVAEPSPLRMDAMFRIHSMTKPITTAAAMQLYEQGRFLLTDSVARYVPEFTQLAVLKDGKTVPAKRRMTMHHLLTHTAGLSYGFDPSDPVDKLYLQADLWQSKDLDEFAGKLARLPLRHEPGSRWHYSVATDLLGLIVQRLSGQPLDEYLSEHILRPLDMVDTSFVVPADKAHRLVPVHRWHRSTQQLSLAGTGGTAGAAAQLASKGPLAAGLRAGQDMGKLFSGGGGLVSTMRDYVRFAEAVRAGGTVAGTRILSSKTVEYMTRGHLQGVLQDKGASATLILPGSMIHGANFGLGFAVVVDPATNGVIGSPGQLYWHCASGTSFLIDPEEDIVMVSMMQLANPSYQHSYGLHVATHQAISESKTRHRNPEYSSSSMPARVQARQT